MAREKNEGVCCAMCGAASLCCCIVLVVLFLFGLGVAKIVLGAIYLHDCSIERLIPIYLIVSGVAPILLGGLGRKSDDKRGEDGNTQTNLCATCCGLLGFLFNLSWLICGSIWVYPNYGVVMSSSFHPCTGNATSNCTIGTCDETLMKFAFGMVTFDWITMGFWCMLVCCMLCRAFCKQ